MNTAKRSFLLATLKMFYGGLMVLCFGLATALVGSQGRGGVSLSAFLSMRIKLANFVVLAAVLLVWHLIFSLLGFFQSKRLATQLSLVADAAKATTLAAIALMAMAKLFTVTMVTPGFLLIFWILSSTLVVCARVSVRH